MLDYISVNGLLKKQQGLWGVRQLVMEVLIFIGLVMSDLALLDMVMRSLVLLSLDKRSLVLFGLVI